METKEIHEGYWYLFDGKPKRIALIDLAEIYNFTVTGGAANYKPIPLTEEWLIRAGFNNAVWKCLSLPNNDDGSINRIKFNSGIVFFEQELTQGFTNKQIFEIMSNANKYYDLDDMSFLHKQSTIFISTSILYVHQLQKLYFTLTGEELIFTL